MQALLKSLFENNIIFKKLLGFSIVGIIVTLFSILLLYLFIQLIGMNVYVGYVISYLLSILLSLLLNNFLVFNSGKIDSKKALKYYLIYLISMIIGLIALWGFEFILPGINKFWLSILCIPITYTWNFLFTNKLLSK
jgi:putative flippase GtrA